MCNSLYYSVTRTRAGKFLEFGLGYSSKSLFWTYEVRHVPVVVTKLFGSIAAVVVVVVVSVQRKYVHFLLISMDFFESSM
jgi:hypothetical protein